MKFIIKVSLELMIAEFVAFLVPAIVLSIFLYGVIGEMYELVSEVLVVVVFGGGADVALFVPIKFMSAVYCDHDHVGSDIEFAAVV